MSPALASLLGLALYAGLLLPLGWAAFKPARYLSATYGLLILVVAIYQTGFFQRSSLTEISDIHLSAAPPENQRCDQMLELLERSGLRIDTSDPSAPTITGPGANQIPPQIRDVLIECVRPEAEDDRQGDTLPPLDAL